MIRSSTTQTLIVTNVVFSFLALPGSDTCLAQATPAPGAVLPLSPAPAPEVDVQRAVPRTVQWEQREYPASEVTEVLMGVIMDARADPLNRTKAFRALSPVARKLRNTDHIPKLMDLYDTCTDKENRRWLLGILAYSEDPRALPLFVQYLKEDMDDVDRWQCGGALAQWNIRLGVAALIDLLESQKLGPEGQSFADIPMGTLLGLSRDKGWGLPDVDIVERIDKIRPKVNDEERRVLFRTEVKKWFEANKHRFPDWKPGDPLPVVEEPSPESVRQSRIASYGWTCSNSCTEPADYDDCAACCSTRDACVKCFDTSFHPILAEKMRTSYCDSAFNP